MRRGRRRCPLIFGMGSEEQSQGIPLGLMTPIRAYLGTAIDGVKNGMYLNVTFNNFGRGRRTR